MPKFRSKFTQGTGRIPFCDCRTKVLFPCWLDVLRDHLHFFSSDCLHLQSQQWGLNSFSCFEILLRPATRDNCAVMDSGDGIGSQPPEHPCSSPFNVASIIVCLGTFGHIFSILTVTHASNLSSLLIANAYTVLLI
jgi:hypothetical protein